MLPLSLDSPYSLPPCFHKSSLFTCMGMRGICLDLNIWSCASESPLRSQLLNKHREGDAARLNKLYRAGSSPGSIALHWTRSTFCSEVCTEQKVERGERSAGSGSRSKRSADRK